MSEAVYFTLLSVVLGALFVGALIHRVLQRYPDALVPTYRRPLKELLVWAARDAEMQRRVLITVGILIVLQLAFFIPLPGVNVSALKELSSVMDEFPGSSMFTGGIMAKFSVFQLGLSSFFASCIIIQLVSVGIPALRRLTFGGEHGREKISKYTYLLTVILCLINAYPLSLFLERNSTLQGVQILTMHGWAFRLTSTATMTAAVMLLLFMATVICRHGIGNGVAVIAVSSILPRLVSAVYRATIQSEARSIPPHVVVLVVVMSIVMVLAIFYVSRRARAIEVEDESGKRSSVYLRPSMIGRVPITFALSLIYFPVQLASLTDAAWLKGLADAIRSSSVAFIVADVVLIVFLACIYAIVVFNVTSFSELLIRHGYRLPQLGDTSLLKFLDAHMTKIILFAGAFLAVIAITPELAMAMLNIPASLASVIGGTSLLMVGGVAADIVSQLEFFKERRESDVKDWRVCYVAFDEIEATIKSEYLKGKGTPAIVEPLRFTWGMPIRTMVDQYRIYVPAGRKDEARKLIL